MEVASPAPEDSSLLPAAPASLSPAAAPLLAAAAMTRGSASLNEEWSFGGVRSGCRLGTEPGNDLCEHDAGRNDQGDRDCNPLPAACDDSLDEFVLKDLKASDRECSNANSSNQR